MLIRIRWMDRQWRGHIQQTVELDDPAGEAGGRPVWRQEKVFT
jgi:hypothetical protein